MTTTTKTLIAAAVATGLGQSAAAGDEAAVLSTIDTMTSAFAAGDIDAIMSTYADGAVVVAEPGSPVGGDAALRAMFAGFIASGVNFDYGAHEVIIAGDTALHLMKWTAQTPDGEDASALSVAVLQRATDGTWRMVIDHPFGDGVMHN